MRKSNSALVLFIFVMFVSMVLGIVFADNEESDENDYESFSIEEKNIYQKVLIEPEYTTLYENDEMNIELGFNETPSSEKIPFYIEFDNTVFDVDLTNMIIADGYKYIKHEEVNTSNMTRYIFYYDINKKISLDYLEKYPECVYFEDEYRDNKAVDEVIFSKIKLRVKDTAKLGVSKIYSGYTNSSEKNYSPISIIKKENNTKTISDINNSSCNIKCKAVNAGRNLLNCGFGSVGCSENEKIIFEDGTIKKYNTTCLDNIYYLNTKYNTIYTDDEVNLQIKRENSSDSTYLIYDEKTSEYQKYENGGYKVKPFAIVFENDAFDINVNNIKFENEKYKLKDYKIKKSSNSIAYILYLEFNDEITEGFPINEEKLFLTWKVTTKENITSDTYYIKLINEIEKIDELDVSFSLDNIYSYSDYYPINVIEKNNKNNSLKQVNLYLGAFGLTGNLISIDISEDKETYEYAYSDSINSIEYMNVICNKKCYVEDNGNILLDINENFKLNVKYEDGTNKTYNFNNEIKNHTKLYPITYSFYDVIIIGNGNQKGYQEYIDKIMDYIEKRKEEIGYSYQYYKPTYYNYDELTQAEKKVFGIISETFEKEGAPLIFIFDDLDEFENYIAGDFSDEELYEYICKELEITYQEENANNSNTISNNDDNKKEEIINTKDEESLVKKYNMTIIISVLGGISLFIFLIIIIFLVKNKKIKNQNKILQQNQKISSSQEQEEQNKTLEQ